MVNEKIKNTKIRVKTSEAKKLVQEKYFELEGHWDGSHQLKTLAYDFLSCDNSGYMCQIRNEADFMANTFEEITAEELLGRKTDDKPTHIIIWDTDCGDPHKVVYSIKEVREEIKILFETRDVINSSIEVFELKEKFIPNMNVSLSKVN